jgi:hypothetical protein
MLTVVVHIVTIDFNGLNKRGQNLCLEADGSYQVNTTINNTILKINFSLVTL